MNFLLERLVYESCFSASNTAAKYVFHANTYLNHYDRFLYARRTDWFQRVGNQILQGSSRGIHCHLCAGIWLFDFGNRTFPQIK